MSNYGAGIGAGIKYTPAGVTRSVSPGSHTFMVETPGVNGPGRKRIRKRALHQRIGIWGICVIFGGVLLQLGIVSFLAYLWSQQGRHDVENPIQRTWRTIVLNVWMAPTITLSTVLIRFILGSQLILCTALVAGLIIETVSARIEDAPKFSVLRVYNSGPLDVVWLMSRLPHHFCRSIPGFLIILLYLVGVALQFSSTLLVSDLGDIPIDSDPDIQEVAVSDSTGSFVAANSDYLWTKSLGTWPTYAETRVDNGTVSTDVSDTGTIFKAFLPFEAQKRLLLRSYDGLAVVQEARTVCVPATLDNTQFGLYRGTDQLALEGVVSASLDAFHHAGFVFYNKTYGIDNSNVLGKRAFNCPFVQNVLPSPSVRGDSLEMAICTINGSGFRQFLLINALGSYLDWYNDMGPGGPLQWTANENGWANYVPAKTASKEKGLVLSASVCGFNFNHTLQNISASTENEPEEFSLQWNNHTGIWNTDPIMRQLGVIDTASDPTDRGLLHLNKHELAPGNPSPQVFFNFPTNDVSAAMMQLAFNKGLLADNYIAKSKLEYSFWAQNTSIVFCTRCTDNARNESVHPAHVLLMQSAFNATNNPASALDALWTTWAQTMYSGSIGGFDYTGDVKATMIWATTVLAPRRWSGFIAVAALLVAHIIAMAIVVILFAIRTSHTFNGDVWHAVAQASAGEEMKEILEDVTSSMDKEARSLIAARGMNGMYMGTQVDRGTGRVQIVRRNPAWKKKDSSAYT
ncbi:hypothetical protein GGS26DRAFT_241015 [Hypomontagnella submonticulosa]|nr:hypothetical protein GGS26DRAFT_241015 [Hypomontagnella submonticulosa]